MGKPVTIFDYSGKFDSSIYDLVMSGEANPSVGWNEYFSSLSGVGKLLADSFPLLSYHHLPTSRPSLSFISGELIPRGELRIYGVDTAIKKHISLPVFAVIPSDYHVIGIQIYDSTRCILWDKIPYEKRHCFPPYHGFTRICSHRLDDLAGLTPQGIIRDCLQSAWHLYTEYRRYDNTGRFDLDCHPHPDGGEK